MLVGSHLSIAGGMHLAIEAAVRLGLDCVQVFTKNQRQWRVKPLVQAEIDAFRAAVRTAGWDRHAERRLVSHNSYLVNLASPDRAMRARSRALQREEVERCEALGIPSCVMHPGAHLGTAGDDRDEAAGIKRLVAELDAIHRDTRGYATVTCLENTVGSGTNLGGPLEHLARIRASVRDPERVAFCIDTCHATAYGHDASTPAKAASFWKSLDAAIGIGNVRVIHANDSQGALGSHLDRHAHLGSGACGRAFFASIAHRRGLRQVPCIMETPKEGRLRGRDPDRANAAWLRALTMMLACTLAAVLLAGCRPWAKADPDAVSSRPSTALAPTPEEAGRLQRARDVAARGEYQEALAEFRALLAENPRLAVVQVAVGEVTREQGDLRAAQRSYEAALETDPRNVDALIGLAGVHAEAGRVGEALRIYRQALSVAPADPRAVTGVADMLERSGDHLSALPFLERRCADPGADSDSWTRLGRAYLLAGRTDDATVAFEEAASLGEVSEQTMDGLIVSYMTERRFMEASSAADEFARRWPSAPACERAAWLSFRAGDYERAAAGYRAAVAIDPSSVRGWNGIGTCALNGWLLSDRLDGAAREEARRAFERSLELRPDQPQVTDILRTWSP